MSEMGIRTRDMMLAAALSASGHELTAADGESFTFQDGDACKRTSDKYFAKALPLDALTLFQTLRALMGRRDFMSGGDGRGEVLS